MVISAVTPQQWIDGKILGVSAYALAFTFTTVTSILLFVLVSQAFGSGWTIPVEVTNPFIILSLILLGLAGFLLWNTVFAAVSATVNDPNTSARGTLLLAPFAPAIFAIFAYKNPDSIGLQILSFIKIKIVLFQLTFLNRESTPINANIFHSRQFALIRG